MPQQVISRVYCIYSHSGIQSIEHALRRLNHSKMLHAFIWYLKFLFSSLDCSSLFSSSHDRFRYGNLYYRFRRAWRRISDKKYRLYTRVGRKWRRVIRRGRRSVIRVGRRYRVIRITRTTVSYRKGKRWVRVRRRKPVRRTRRRRRRRFRRRRRYSVMRVYVTRRWRTVYKSRGTFYFRYGRRRCSLRYN